LKRLGRPTPASSRARLAAATIGAALALAACGDADEPEDAEPVGPELAGSVAPLAQCRDWVEASEEEKLATIADIRSQVNREDAGVTASELTDDEAMEVLDNGCADAFAAGFRLHVLYARAAAFKPLREIAEGESG
jgi:hypothetical protein